MMIILKLIIYYKIPLFIFNIYFFFYNIILNFLPIYTLLKTYKHDTFSVHKYRYIYNKKYYYFKFINFNKNYTDNVISDIDIDITNRNLINHCCILDINGDYIRDITQEIRMFIHLNKKIEWKYILIHLNVINYSNILININDDDLTEKQLYITNLLNNNILFNVI